MEINTSGLTEWERQTMKEARWWSVPELEAAADQIFVPRRFPFPGPLVAGIIPAEPIEVGV